MNRMKRILTLLLSGAVLSTASVVGSFTASASVSGAGLTEWAYRAYNEGWQYVWGGSSVGAVDCSGLIYSYAGGERVTEGMIAAASQSGSMSSLPRIHGLGLYQYGHVGVYVGGGMAIDARDEASDVCLESVYTKSWTQWFKVSTVNYPESGWVNVAGSYFFYENGEYIVSTSRTIDGVTYSFGSDGASDTVPASMGSGTVSKPSQKKTTQEETEKVVKKVKKVKKTAFTLGDSGNAVTKIQNRLTELGFYNAEVTGYFGELTLKAYKKFQKAAGVTVDGICGKSDRDILYSDNAPVYTPPVKTEKPKTEEAPKEEEPKTEEKTVEEAPAKKEFQTLSLEDEGKKVTKVQTRLSELRYMSVEASGYFDTDTQYAVMDFQDYNGLERTGEVDKQTYKALFDEEAVANPDVPKEDEAEEKQEAEKKAEEKEEAPAEEAPQEEQVSFEFREAVPSDYFTGNTDDSELIPATSTELVLESHEMASKALAGAGVASESDSFFRPAVVSPQAKSGIDIIKWLVVVIAVMGVMFVIALVNDRKQAKRRRKHAAHGARN